MVTMENEIYEEFIVGTSKWLLETPAEDLTAKDYLKCKNGQERIVFMEKCGFIKLSELGIVVDTFENYPQDKLWAEYEYKIIDMNKVIYVEENKKNLCSADNYGYSPFLYYKHKLTGEYRLKCLTSNCKTILDALKIYHINLASIPRLEGEDADLDERILAKVSKWLSETPAEDLTAKDYLKCKNELERDVFIQKCGFMKLSELGIVVDTFENYPQKEMWAEYEYKIIDMNKVIYVEENEKNLCPATKSGYSPYLCFKLIDEYYLECLTSNCKTILDALKIHYINKNLIGWRFLTFK